jgi:nucleoside-diphosphate-sugar epimerase
MALTEELPGAAEVEVDRRLVEPSLADVASAQALKGDLIVLGAGGKMGPTLVRRVRKAIRRAGVEHRVIAVVRKDRDGLARRFASEGIELLEANLMDPASVERLPDAPNVIFMVGRKFGSVGGEPLTWATNTWAAGLTANRYPHSRIVVFSTGNVYPFMPVNSGGANETTPPAPVGEYAQSALARERIFQHFAQVNGTPVLLFRLNYAIDARYGVLLDIAAKVYAGQPVGLAMGYANVIWQGDANSYCFRSLELCKSTAPVLNVTGAEVISVREIALAFGRRWGRTPVFEGAEAPTALLSNAEKCRQLLGNPGMTVPEMVEIVAQWVESGSTTLGKPTGFERRDGSF